MGQQRVRSVGAIVFDASGRLLLIRRGHEPAKGRWSVPGGKVEPGETDAEAVVREVAEETGLTLRVGDLAGTVDRSGGPGVVYEVSDYDAGLTDGPVTSPPAPAEPHSASASPPSRADHRPGFEPGVADVNISARAPAGEAAGVGCATGPVGEFARPEDSDGSRAGRAASDADDLRWVTPEELTSLPLTDGLVESLRAWGRLA
jgi:ADP-ribose pyrophosphatase YjhB (NUDIX family)